MVDNERRYFFETSDPHEWSKVIRDVFGGLEVIVKEPEKFHGTVEAFPFAEITVALVTSNFLKVWHSGSIGTYSAKERFLVKTQLRGQSHFSIGNTRVTLHAGEFIICDNARAYTFEFEEITEIVSIPIPKEFIGRFFAHPEDIAFIKSSQDSALTRLTSTFLKSLWDDRECNSFERHERDLISNYFELLVKSYEAIEPNENAVSAVQVNHLKRCKAYIEESLDQVELSPRRVADAMNLSVRYVSTLFSNTGETVGKYILSSRLDHSAQMLRSKRFDDMTIAEIAYRCGFKSAAHFSRCFKDRFSSPPKIYRSWNYR